jgi:hypothetical protein
MKVTTRLVATAILVSIVLVIWRHKWKGIMSGHEMREHALRRYIVFRVKAMEFLDLNTVRQTLRTNQFNPVPQFRPPIFMSDSVRTVVLSWFALFVDKNGMDVIKLWIELFPKHAKQIQETWTRIEPAWDAIREFRDRASFHADKPKKFFGARHRVLTERPQFDAAVEEFRKLFSTLLKAEPKELPDLETELDSLLDELEKEHGTKYQREQFKAYLMIPEGSSGPKP